MSNQVKHKNWPESSLRLTCRKGDLEGANQPVFLNTPNCFVSVFIVTLPQECYQKTKSSLERLLLHLASEPSSFLFCDENRFCSISSFAGSLWNALVKHWQQLHLLFRFNTFVSLQLVCFDLWFEKQLLLKYLLRLCKRLAPEQSCAWTDSMYMLPLVFNMNSSAL